MGAGYRAGQFFKAVGALTAGGLAAADRAVVAAALPADLQALFFRMAPNDQRHCLEVHRLLRAQGFEDADLLAAALLHDCGKALVRIGLWQRVALVLIKAVRPALLDSLAGTEPAADGPRRSWRYAFYVQREHARLGADLAERAGAPPTVIAFILLHETPLGTSPQVPEDAMLLALQQADSLS